MKVDKKYTFEYDHVNDFKRSVISQLKKAVKGEFLCNPHTEWEEFGDLLHVILSNYSELLSLRRKLVNSRQTAFFDLLNEIEQYLKHGDYDRAIHDSLNICGEVQDSLLRLFTLFDTKEYVHECVHDENSLINFDFDKQCYVIWAGDIEGDRTVYYCCDCGERLA